MIHTVKMQHQKIQPPAILAATVGTKWWRMNCHGAKTLASVEGITRPDVRRMFSTFEWHGYPTKLYHEGPHAWLRSTVEAADSGHAVRARTVTVDDSAFVPMAIKGTPRTTDTPRTACGLRVRKFIDSGPWVACDRRTGHTGPCSPKSRGAHRGKRNFDR